MAYDYRINAQAPKQGIGAFQAGQQMGGGFGRLAGAGVDVYQKGKQEEQDLAKKQKIDALVMKYNNENSPEFMGLDPKTRALKLSRLLYPLDEGMASRYEQQARSITEKTSLFDQQEKLKKMGQKKEAKNKFNAKLGSLFRNIQDKETWDSEKAKWGNETELFIPEWESGTRLAWIEDAIKLGTKAEKAVKPLDSSQKKSVVTKGYQALLQGKPQYKAYYDSLDEETKKQVAIPSPDHNRLEQALLAGGADVQGVEELGRVKAEAKLGTQTAGAQSERYGSSNLEYGGMVHEGLDTRRNEANKDEIKSLRSEYKTREKELEKVARGTKESLNAIKGVLKGVTDSSPATGINATVAMFRFMKGIDEGGIVRDSDLQMLMKTMGFVGKWENIQEQIESGFVITKTQLDAMESYLSTRSGNDSSYVDELTMKYIDDAINNGYHPNLVVGYRAFKDINEED